MAPYYYPDIVTPSFQTGQIMFNQIHKILTEAQLKHLNIKLNSQGSKLQCVLSCATNSEFPVQAFNTSKNNDQLINDVIELRALLSTPLVIVGSPSEIDGMVVEQLESIFSGVTQANATISANNLSDLLITKSATVNPVKSSVIQKKMKEPEPTITNSIDYFDSL